MRCEICGVGPIGPDGTAHHLHRQNEKGVKGVWRCERCNMLPVDEEVQSILDAISPIPSPSLPPSKLN